MDLTSTARYPSYLRSWKYFDHRLLHFFCLILLSSIHICHYQYFFFKHLVKVLPLIIRLRLIWSILPWEKTTKNHSLHNVARSLQFPGERNWKKTHWNLKETSLTYRRGPSSLNFVLSFDSLPWKKTWQFAACIMWRVVFHFLVGVIAKKHHWKLKEALLTSFKWLWLTQSDIDGRHYLALHYLCLFFPSKKEISLINSKRVS